MIGRRERNRLERRRSIRLAGLRLFAVQGYEQTTVADIADAADVALRTVSLYFPTKLDIALSAVDEMLVDLLPALADLHSGTPLIDIYEGWLNTLMGQRDLETIDLLRQLFDRNPEMRALVLARVNPHLPKGSLLLLADPGDVDQEFASRMVKTLMVNVIAQLIAAPPTIDADRAVSAAMAFMRGGISALEQRRETSNSRPATEPGIHP